MSVINPSKGVVIKTTRASTDISKDEVDRDKCKYFIERREFFFEKDKLDRFIQLKIFMRRRKHMAKGEDWGDINKV